MVPSKITFTITLHEQDYCQHYIPARKNAQGRTWPYGVRAFFATLFELNEIRHPKLTDEEIAYLVSQEFLSRPISLATVRAYRKYFNAGECYRFYFPPSPSFRYNLKGAKIGRQSSPLTPEKVSSIIVAHKARKAEHDAKLFSSRQNKALWSEPRYVEDWSI